LKDDEMRDEEERKRLAVHSFIHVNDEEEMKK
jgi:hypothetical protein